MNLQTEATLLKIDDIISRKGEKFAKVSIFFDENGQTAQFFLGAEKLAMVQQFLGVKLAKVLCDIRFYVKADGNWGASLEDIVYSKD